MSLTSLACNLEVSNSTHLDSEIMKAPKFGSTSTNFQEFLANSPYANIKKSFYSPRNQVIAQKGEYPSSFGEFLEVPRHQKTNETITINEPLPISPIEVSNEDPSAVDTSMFQNPLEGTDILKSPKASLNLGETTNQTRQHINRHRVVRVSNIYTQGFDSPKASATDFETRKMVKELQARIVGMEKEMLKIKKENHDLREENKKYKESMKSVVVEQEKAAKAKELYEKKISSLRENCVNNEQTANSLREILSLQEIEFQDRHSHKDRGMTLPNVDNLAPPTRGGNRHLRTLSNVDMTKVNRVSSIEANLDDAAGRDSHRTQASRKSPLPEKKGGAQGQSQGRPLLERRPSKTFSKNLKVAVKT